MEIIKRKGRKADVVRINYEYTDQLKHLSDAGQVIGKKSKKDRAREEKKENKQEEVKQINGRYHSRESAEAAGLNWNDY